MSNITVSLGRHVMSQLIYEKHMGLHVRKDTLALNMPTLANSSRTRKIRETLARKDTASHHILIQI